MCLLKTMNIMVKPVFSNKLETFQVFYRQGELGFSVNRSKTHNVEKKWTYNYRKPKKLVFGLPRNSTDTIRIDPGEHESSWQIREITFHSHFLGYYPKVMTWDMKSIIAHAKPLNKVHLSEDDEGFLTVKNLGGDAQFTLPFDTRLFDTTVHSSIIKIIYVFLLGALAWLIWVFKFSTVRNYTQPFLVNSKDDGFELSKQFFQVWKSRKVWLLTGGIIFIATNLYRLWPSIAAAALHGEDAIEFSDFYSGRSLSDAETWHYYRGYTVVLMRLVAWFCTRFPIEWQPYIFAIMGITFTTIAILITAWCGLLQRRSILFIAPIALGMLGMNHSIFYLSVTQILYSGVLIVFALLFYPFPKQTYRYTGLLLLMCFLVWSGPYSVQLIPVALALILFFYNKQKAVALFLIALSAFFYLKSSSSGLLQLENLAIPGVHHAFMRAMLEKVFLFNLFWNIHYLVALSILIAIVAVAYFLRHDRQYVKVAVILMGLIISSMLSYFISVKYTQYGGEIIEAHTILSQYAWVLLLLYTADRLLLKLSPDKLSFSSFFVIAVFVSVTVFSQYQQPFRYQHNVDPRLKGYFKAIRTMEKQDLLIHNQYVILSHINAESLQMDVHIGSKQDDATRLMKDQVPISVVPFFHEGETNRKRGRILRL